MIVSLPERATPDVNGKKKENGEEVTVRRRRRREFNQGSEEGSQLAVAWYQAGQASTLGLEGGPPPRELLR
jgi:hypothetical protein